VVCPAGQSFARAPMCALFDDSSNARLRPGCQSVRTSLQTLAPDDEQERMCRLPLLHKGSTPRGAGAWQRALSEWTQRSDGTAFETAS
jgi:hypothetical protein